MKTSRRIVVAGTTAAFLPELLEDRRLFAANALDTSFAGTGAVISRFGTSAQFTSVVALSNGKVLAAGSVENGAKQHDFLIVRYNADGSLDTTFGNGTGRVFTDFSGRNDFAARILLTGGGKFAVVGSTLPGDPFTGTSSEKQDFAVARYNASGSLDTSFSSDGKARVDFAGHRDDATAAAVLAGGKLLVVGTVDTQAEGQGSDFGAVRFNFNGSLDTTFANKGKLDSDFGVEVETPFFNGIYGEQTANAVAILPGGGFLIAGGIDDFYDSGLYFSDFAVAKYTPSGSLDKSFGGGNGWLQVHHDAQVNAATSIAVLPNGKILLGGQALPFGEAGALGYFALARVNANGTVDASFGDHGTVTTDLFRNQNDSGFTDSVSGISGMIVQPNGKIFATGTCRLYDPFFNSISLLAMVRYNANGSLDTGFSGDGKQLYGALDGGNAIAAAPGGKTVVAGFQSKKAGVARFRSDAPATAKISGTFFNDVDADGIKGPSDKPLAAWKAFIDANNDGVFTPGETYAYSDSTGKYQLTGLTPGTYRIREVRHDGWVRTKPAGVFPQGYYDVTVAVGQAAVGTDFGNRKS